MSKPERKGNSPDREPLPTPDGGSSGTGWAKRARRLRNEAACICSEALQLRSAVPSSRTAASGSSHADNRVRSGRRRPGG